MHVYDARGCVLTATWSVISLGLYASFVNLQGAMTTFTKGLGPHLITRGIRVNAIAPGPVWTPLIQQSYPPEQVLQMRSFHI